MSYKTELQGNNTDLQAILDMILALGLVSKPLDECTWEEISNIAAAGKAQNYWSVGDCKKITINGTIGILELSNYETYAYIIGFDHNGETNTIDFGTFKTALSGGTDICLIDGSYNSYKTDGTKLGSTNTNDDNATTTTATSPVSGTLMAALPAELRAVMKPMTIYTDNTGRGSNTASYVTKTVDYLPLLAEFEIFGTRSYANSAEQNYQKQYAYYSAGNSKVKYRHSATGSTAGWWERSPSCNGSTGFCRVYADGGAGYAGARYSYGLAPIFRV